MYTLVRLAKTATRPRSPVLRMRASGARTGSRSLFAALVVSVLCHPALAQAAGDLQIDLASHRAIYDMTLTTSGAGGGTTGKGRMVYEIRGAECAGYSISTRWVAEWGGSEGAVAVEDFRFASFEDVGGSSLSFHTTRYRDHELIEEMEGHVVPGAGNEAGTIALSKPEPVEAPLPPGTVFPLQHVKMIIARGRAGETTSSDRVYDLSEDGKAVYYTFSVLSPLGKRQLSKAVAAAPALGGLPAWTWNVSYFVENGDGEQVPEYEHSSSLFANGVATRMRLGTADVVIEAEITDLEMLPPSGC